MNGPYGTRLADVDEPEELVEIEDAALMTALGVWSVKNALRPPDPDEMPGQPWAPHPGSLRAEAIALFRAVEEVEAVLRRTWRGRLILAGAWMASRVSRAWR